MPEAQVNLVNVDLIICCITVLGSIVVAAFTYWNVQRLKFFETYFSEKAKAYGEFLNALSHSVERPQNVDVESLIAIGLKAKLYCSEHAYNAITDILTSFLNMANGNGCDLTEFGIQYEKAVLVFREDLQNCRKFKFQ